MEGPSLKLAAEQLSPFINQIITGVSGNTSLLKERLRNLRILNIFSYGKYLIFQFEHFAMTVHFLLFGSFEAIVNGKKVNGDYPRKQRPARLSIASKIGSINMFSCSIKFIEQADLKAMCDFSIDTIHAEWDDKKAFAQLQKNVQKEIADVLLDQTIFMGVGNIIKNEVLFLAKIKPTTQVNKLSLAKKRQIIQLIRVYVFQFYEWRKLFELKKHYQVYRQSLCKVCGGKVKRMKTGDRQRISYLCLHCQK